MNRIHLRLAIPVLALAACFTDVAPSTDDDDDDGSPESSQSDSQTDTAGEGPSATASLPAEPTGTSGTSQAETDAGGPSGPSGPIASGTSTGSEPECGNGQVEPGEECDDGDDQPTDGCSSQCEEEVQGCSRIATTIAVDLEAGIAVCQDADAEVCEQDFADLCGDGWHLCSGKEHVYKNDAMQVELDGIALGVARCRLVGGAGHYTVSNFNVDGPDNCEVGSSRPDCPTSLGCNETMHSALCCSNIPSCGNGVVDEPLEECDDGNDEDYDDCSTSCASRRADGPYC